MMVGGERYEMVPLPDSMVETTLFVGNLCEFVKDDDLSDLFQTVSNLHSVPACVARKANMNSLQYGFVTFPTVEEKEKALVKFHGYELNGRKLKVECIRDEPRQNRVRVPERLVAYLCGEAKRTSDGGVNTLRRVTRAEVSQMSNGKSSPTKKKIIKKPTVPMRLNDKEQQEMERAERKGFVSLLSVANRRGRTNSALANVHREWCDSREKPQIILCKATGGRPLDHVIVDLSPLRIHGILDDPDTAEDFLIRWKTQILLAAEHSGMELRDDYFEDNTLESSDVSVEGEPCDMDTCTELVMTIDREAWRMEPICRLPVVSIGVFEGERARAKAMAKELAELWDIPEEAKGDQSDEETEAVVCRAENSSDRRKGKNFREKRRRSRNKVERDRWTDSIPF
jgi:hypothetical protein